MEQLQYLNKVLLYGNKKILKGKISGVKSILEKIIKDHNLTLNTVEVNLISDAELLKINIDSLNHNYYTDIITFDYTDNEIITGDIYISMDRIQENAKSYKTSNFEELLRVMCHGVLHLSGYKDKSKMEKTKMTEMENKYLKLYYKLFHVEQK